MLTRKYVLTSLLEGYASITADFDGANTPLHLTLPYTTDSMCYGAYQT